LAGVKTVVEQLDVKFDNNWDIKDDNDIAREVLNAFTWNWQVPEDSVKVTVENGWVTLEGVLQDNYQSMAAKNAVKNLLGIVGVSNNIRLKSDEDKAAEKRDIENALKLHWSLYDTHIGVKVSGHKATLTGSVYSGYQKSEAGRIAANARGICAIDNDLVVDHEYALIADR
jgi:osmotically-inducible protein OsmY